jgi:hypothetical protein
LATSTPLCQYKTNKISRNAIYISHGEITACSQAH